MDRIKFFQQHEQYTDRQERKQRKRQARIEGAVYLLCMFILPIFVGCLFNSIFNFNDELPSLQSVSLVLIAAIGFIAWNGIQMLRTDKFIQKATDAYWIAYRKHHNLPDR